EEYREAYESIHFEFETKSEFFETEIEQRQRQTFQGSVKEGREMLRVLGKRASCKRLSQEKEREEGEGEGFEINSRISRNERNSTHEPYDQFKKRRQNIPRSTIWPTRIPQSSDDFCS